MVSLLNPPLGDDIVELYRIKLKLTSAFLTPWASDTIMGQLCWVLEERFGGTFLDELITYFEEGIPPFVISAGFPGDLLPRPLLPQRKSDTPLTLEEL